MIPAGIIAIVVVPILVGWSLRLAYRASPDGTTFRPVAPVRAIYPAVVGASLLGIISSNIWGNLNIWGYHEDVNSGDWMGLAGLAAVFLIAVVSWPATFKVTKEGVKWYRLLRRGLIRWDAIEAVSTDMDGDLIIYRESGSQFQVSRYTEGRSQLKTLIEGGIRCHQSKRG